ncbi:MAG: PilZ domain-containing protein [Nitrospira sp.]|nr:MAG: PilZ domain-containing protein [Nitrospira sp.]
MCAFCEQKWRLAAPQPLPPFRGNSFRSFAEATHWIGFLIRHGLCRNTVASVVAPRSAGVQERSKEGHAMVSRQIKIGDSRAHERVTLRCSIALARGLRVGEGWTLDMSECGCLVESSLPVKVGDNLQVRLLFHGSEPSMRVSLAVVRWVQGFRFGIQFIGIEEQARARLNRYLLLLGGDPWSRTFD